MKGEGNYNKNSGQQRKALDRAIKAVERNVTAMSERSLLPLPGATAGHFTIADYGASQGANSIIVCEKVVAILRKRHAQLPIVIVHEDLDENDWTTLFKTSHSCALPSSFWISNRILSHNSDIILRAGLLILSFDQLSLQQLLFSR